MSEKANNSNHSYHHGDLRNSLIEAGIECIGQYGEEKLSLRKVAEKCGVSCAAPYAHFSSKDELLLAIQEHIMQEFTEALQKSAEEHKGSPEMITEMGKAYIMFFYENPLYFDFIFSRKNIKIKLALSVSEGEKIPPLEVFRKAAGAAFQAAGFSEKEIQNKIIGLWALVHGLTAISIMPNVEYDGNWEERFVEIIKSISVPFVSERERK